MKRFACAFLLSICLLFNLPTTLIAQENIHHDLQIQLEPEKHWIEVEDTITLPEVMLKTGTHAVHFVLHSGLHPISKTDNVTIIKINKNAKSLQLLPEISAASLDNNLQLEYFIVTLPDNKNSFTIKYTGEIYHPLQSEMEESNRSFRETPGLISPDGTYIASSTYWYPWFNDDLITFSMNVRTPEGWKTVSNSQWETKTLQDEIFLIAGKFTEYSGQAGSVRTQVFLRKPDEALANKYLETGAQYLKMYSKLLGPYPYNKFALIENFWETGYGMPSFSLLGPKVIRFPFILHSSFPHEILHNWWGNGVFVDYDEGNWSEGLTAYLSDHLIKEQRGNGAEYRRNTLQKYADYVTASKDFPISEFRSRHSPVTEAVGYGKTLMFINMLRKQLGDDIFVRGLQKFYKENSFNRTNFTDLENALSSVSGKSLQSEFNQWTKKTGAPELRVSNAIAKPEKEGYLLNATIEQVQKGTPYKLQIPVAVTIKGRKEAYQTNLQMNSRQMEISLHLTSLPLRLDVDPEFDLFRRLDRNEVPPALSQAFGAEKVLMILPAAAPVKVLAGYRKLAEAWQSPLRQIEIKLDREIEKLPADKTVWIFGNKNHFFSKFLKTTDDYSVSINKTRVKIGKKEVLKKNHSIIITARHHENPEHASVWVAVDNEKAIPGLARKLPHYGKYSYLAFEGDQPSIVLKGQWPTVNSPLSIGVRQSKSKGIASLEAVGKLTPRTALAYLPPVFSEKRMMETVRFLSDKKLKGRGFGSDGLNVAADYIASKFREAGLQPVGDKKESFFQEWKVHTKDAIQKQKHGKEVFLTEKVSLKNVIGIIPGNRPEWKDQSVLVSAHYDHLGLGWPDVRKGNEGKVHPGADDNASGVAILLELAKLLGKNWKPDRTVVFAAFSGEEAGRLGSIHYVKNEKRFPVEKSIGALNLDTVGRLEKGKLTILGTGSAREWIHIFMGAGYVTGVPISSVADDFGSSDQKSFLEAGIPAVQFFSGPHLDYHAPGDTSDKVDSKGLVKIASVVKEAVEYLAGREKPLTSLLPKQRKPKQSRGIAPKTVRKVSLGTIPDFSYGGKGVRIIGVLPNSPAEKAGFQKNDVLTMLNGKPVDNLRSFSKSLKTMKPGDTAKIIFLRNGDEKSVTLKVVER